MSLDDAPRLDPRAIARAFERASAGYDAHAVLATAAASELLRRLEFLAFEPSVVLDLGAGTAEGARALRERWRKAQVVALDSSAGMLEAARARLGWRRHFDRVRADGARLPLRAGSVDLVYSNLMLPWAIDLDAQLREIRRVLRPRGYFTFTTLGLDTLRELRAAARELDPAVKTHPFLDMHDIGDALTRAGFEDPVMDVDRYTLTYESLGALARDLRAVGGQGVLIDRRAGLVGRARQERLAAAYERFRNEDRRLPLSCEVIFGQAWCPGEAPPERSRRRETIVPFTSIGRR